jgi:hypothetical protein
MKKMLSIYIQMARRGSGSSGSIMIIIVLCFIVSLCVISMSYGVVELGDTNKTGIETIKDISSGDKSLNELIDTFKTDGVKSIKDLLSGKVTFNEFKSNLNRDPKPCVGAWGNWDACSKTCGGGLKIREWEVSNDEMDGGTCVNRGKTEDASCNTQACSTSGGGGGSTPTPTPAPTPTPTPTPAQNCVANPNTWGGCTETCGGGTQSRGYTITTAESNGGLCPERTKTDEQACNTQACPPVVLFEDRDKSTLASAVQSKITSYGALGTYRRCMGNDYDWNNKSCKKTTGTASDNASPNIYSLYEDPFNSGTIEKTIAQHWVANDNGVNCTSLFNYDIIQQKVEVTTNGAKENIEIYRVPAANMYTSDYPGAANVGKDLYCPPLYYKVVT